MALNLIKNMKKIKEENKEKEVEKTIKKKEKNLKSNNEENVEEKELYIPEKDYYDYSEEECYILQLRKIYSELKEVAISHNEDETFSHSDIDYIQSCFIEVNDIMSKLKNRHYVAKFEGDWHEHLTKSSLIKFIMKLRSEINNRYGFVLIFEEMNEKNPFHEFYYLENEKKEKNKPKEKKKRSTSLNVSKVSKHKELEEDEDVKSEEEIEEKEFEEVEN